MPVEPKQKNSRKNGSPAKEPAPIMGKPAPVIPADALKLETHNLVKTYGKRTVVSGVSFNVRQGEVVGILGPNGAGKTTSFYMTIGLVKQSGGQVFLGGEDLTDLPMYMRARKGIGYLAQEASIFRTLSVRKNIEAILELRGFSKAEMAARADQLLKELEIEHVQHQNGITLSGGERRRAEIARALASDPKFLLLDEPFAGVDPIAVKEIQRVVWQLQKRGLGILITDHNVRETLKLTDRSYIIFQGQVLIEGTADVLIKDKKAREIYLGEDFKI